MNGGPAIKTQNWGLSRITLPEQQFQQNPEFPANGAPLWQAAYKDDRWKSLLGDCEGKNALVYVIDMEGYVKDDFVRHLLSVMLTEVTTLKMR